MVLVVWEEYVNIMNFLFCVEEIVFGIRIGKVVYLREYYVYWESEIYDVFVFVVEWNIFWLREYFDKLFFLNIILFKLNIILWVGEIVCESLLKEFIRFIVYVVKFIVNVVLVFGWWMDGICVGMFMWWVILSLDLSFFILFVIEFDDDVLNTVIYVFNFGNEVLVNECVCDVMSFLSNVLYFFVGEICC